MRFSILGFSQKNVCSLSTITKNNKGNDIELSLDVNDLLILNLIADFPNRTSVKKMMIDDKVFFWASYEEILNELPILKIKKQALADRFEKMEKLHVIERKFVALDGKHQNTTFFCLTKVYESLLYERVGYRSQLQEGIVVNYETPNNINNNINNIGNNNITDDNNGKEKEYKYSSKKKPKKEFIPPTLDEVKAYIKEKGYHFDARTFIDFYKADDWHYGQNGNRRKMSNWKRSCATWEGTWINNHGGYDMFEQQETTQQQELLLQRFYNILGDEEADIYGMDRYAWHMLSEQQKNYHRKQEDKKKKMLAWIEANKGK